MRVPEAKVFEAIDWLHEQGFDYGIEGGFDPSRPGGETFTFNGKLDALLLKFAFGDADEAASARVAA